MAKCLLPNKVADFKKALKDKEIPLSELLNLDHSALVEKLKPYAGENAKDVATMIEEKLILKNRVQGIKNAISKLTQEGKYSPEQQAKLQKMASDYRAAQQERIFSPDEHESYLGGVVEKELGAEIPREVAKKVFEMQREIDAVKDVNPKMSGVSDEYLEKRTELKNYIDSFKELTPGESIVKNLGVWGRNALISNPSTPIKAFESQAVNSAFEAVARRTAAKSFTGELASLASKANDEAWETFKKTGMNTAGMESMDDAHSLGKGEDFKLPTGEVDTKAGKVISGVEKVVRKAAQLSNKVVIDWAHNVPFTKFYQKTFFDAANFTATDLAKSSKMSAEDIFKDAVRIDPQTPEGQQVRADAQRQAARITSTNQTIFSDFALFGKNKLNKIGEKYLGGFPLGNYIIPIAKIPATAVYNKIYNSGVGSPFAVRDLWEGYSKLGNEETRFEGMAKIKQGWQGISRIIGAVGLGVLLASQLKKEDYREDNFGNSFIRLGDTWINTEYIAFMSPAFVGATKARFAKDQGLASKTSEYFQGAISSMKSLPGWDEESKLRDALVTGKGWQYLSQFFSSRGIPVFLTHPLQPEKLLFGAHGVESSAEVTAEQKAQKAKASAKRKKS